MVDKFSSLIKEFQAQEENMIYQKMWKKHR